MLTVQLKLLLMIRGLIPILFNHKGHEEGTKDTKIILREMTNDKRLNNL